MPHYFTNRNTKQNRFSINVYNMFSQFYHTRKNIRYHPKAKTMWTIQICIITKMSKFSILGLTMKLLKMNDVMWQQMSCLDWQGKSNTSQRMDLPQTHTRIFFPTHHNTGPSPSSHQISHPISKEKELSFSIKEAALLHRIVIHINIQARPIVKMH